MFFCLFSTLSDTLVVKGVVEQYQATIGSMQGLIGMAIIDQNGTEF